MIDVAQWAKIHEGWAALTGGGAIPVFFGVLGAFREWLKNRRPNNDAAAELAARRETLEDMRETLTIMRREKEAARATCIEAERHANEMEGRAIYQRRVARKFRHALINMHQGQKDFRDVREVPPLWQPADETWTIYPDGSDGPLPPA